MIRTYTELSRINGFLERFRYLVLRGQTGTSTFGFDRYINQHFYRSTEWKQFLLDLIQRYRLWISACNSSGDQLTIDSDRWRVDQRSGDGILLSVFGFHFCDWS